MKSAPGSGISTRPRLPGVLLLLAGLSACRDGRGQAILELERRGVSPTPAGLVTAVQENNSQLLDYFGAAGVTAPLPAAGEAGVLHLAAQRQDWPLAGRLLPFCGADLVNHPGPARRVVLELAVLADQFGFARLLLDAGAGPGRAAAGADALVRHASRDPELMDRLLAALPAGHEALTPALLRAVQAGEADRVRRLLEHQAPPRAISPDGQGTALELACQGGFHAIAEQLIKAGARLADSSAALDHAVVRKDVKMVRLLLDAGAALGMAADPETGPLAIALQSGPLEMVRLLLQHGADPGLGAEQAFRKGDAALLELLLEQGLAPGEPGPDGNPPLVRAAIAGHAALIPLLLEKGALLEQTGALGQTAYHMAVILRQAAVVEALLSAGAKPDAPFRKPAPPELIPWFGSDHFAKWYQRDDDLTPLMLAASRGDTAQLRQLLKAGAKRGAQTREWHRYPIVFACDTVNIPAAQLLLGRDPDAETEKRYAVISLSRQRVTLFRNDQPVRSARVSTGKRSTPTPPGKYIITDKQANWVSSIYKVSMPFFMRLSCKEIGLHAGVVPGYPASHGCIRMPRGDVQAFFKTLKIGDPVTIEP